MIRHRILAVDTTSRWGSLALLAGGVVVAERAIESEDGFGHLLFPAIEELIAEQGWNVGEIDCFAAAAGPGSFTGIRVGLSAAKGLGAALSKPVAAISTLAAIAWHGSAPLRAVVLDARRGEIYGAVYSASLETVSPEVVTDPEEWLAKLPEGELELLSPDFSALAEILRQTRFSQIPQRTVPRALAGAVGALAAHGLHIGRLHSPAAAEANYVRLSDAELFWREW